MWLKHKIGLWLKSFNHYLISFQNNVLKNSFVLGLPEYLVVDVTNICNLHCPLCPTGQERKEYPIGKMEFRTFKKIVDELGIWLYEISIGDWGEPFLNDDIYKMLKYAHKANIKTSIFTNLNILDEKMAQEIISSGIDYLYVSIDGVSQNTYEKYRQDGNFDKVMENINLVLRAKEKYKSAVPKIIWQLLVTKYNEMEIDKARAMAKKLGVDFLLGKIRCDTGRELFMNDEEKFRNVEYWLPSNEEYSRYDYATKTRKNKKSYCSFLWTTAVINWDGSVAPCCAVYSEKDMFGNMTNQKFQYIWNNLKYRTARKIVRSKTIDAKIQTVCENCLKNGFID
ncbi:MAG: radical SAM/SPASM domain-containing protein [bacterium]|nr:radical SAM/SPASM domain-containing protein [bacterium]